MDLPPENETKNDGLSGGRLSRLGVVVLIFVSLLAIVHVLPTSDRLVYPKQAAARVKLRSIETALDVFAVDNGFYPPAANGLNDLVKWPKGPNQRQQYLDSIPLDPWGHPYLYVFPGKHNTNSYDLSSAGPDGKFGTADDIGNWGESSSP